MAASGRYKHYFRYFKKSSTEPNPLQASFQRFRGKLSDFQTLLSAESQLLSARNAAVSAQADRASAFVRLTQALGGGWNPQEFPLPFASSGPLSDRTQ